MKNLFHILSLSLALAGTPAIAGDISSDLASKEILYSSYYLPWESLSTIQSKMDGGELSTSWGKSVYRARWTGDCDVTFFAEIAAPILSNRNEAPEDVITEFDRLVDAIKRYEMLQVDIGMYFAEEVKRLDCPENSDEINRYWRVKGAALAARTNRGRTFGVFYQLDR